MRVFVTGGTGFVGSAVITDLLDAGHSVLALARSQESADKLISVGAEPVVGALEDREVLQSAADRADAVIHTAFDNSNVLRFRRVGRIEKAALRSMGEVLRGDDRPIVAAGGFAPVIAQSSFFTELDAASPKAGPVGRNVERTIMELTDDGVNASIVRLPIVHGDDDHFTLPRFIETARKRGAAGYVGDGANRMPAVHNVDAATVFRLAAERAVPGSRYHAVAEEGVPYRGIAEVIGRRLGIPTVSLSPLRARRHFGLYAAYAQSDGPASSTITRDQLGWQPSGPKLLDDLDRPEYFRR